MKFIDDLKKNIFTGTAVYIGDDFVDIARTELTLKGSKITYLQRFPTLKNIKRLSYSEAKEELDRIIEKSAGFEKNKPSRIAVNLKNDYFLLRRFTVKEIPEAELQKAIIFEAQKYLPYAVDDLVYNFEKCDKKGKWAL